MFILKSFYLIRNCSVNAAYLQNGVGKSYCRNIESRTKIKRSNPLGAEYQKMFENIVESIYF
jgi:hypothetical protein